MAPGNRLAVRVEPGLHAVVVIRPVHVVLDVLLAGPDDLHRPVDLLGDLHRLRDEVHLEPAAEAAAEEVVVHHDLLQRQAGDLRGDGLRPADDLRADPDVAAVLARHATVQLIGSMVAWARNGSS